MISQRKNPFFGLEKLSSVIIRTAMLRLPPGSVCHRFWSLLDTLQLDHKAFERILLYHSIAKISSIFRLQQTKGCFINLVTCKTSDRSFVVMKTNFAVKQDRFRLCELPQRL